MKTGPQNLFKLLCARVPPNRSRTLRASAAVRVPAGVSAEVGARRFAGTGEVARRARWGLDQTSGGFAPPRPSQRLFTPDSFETSAPASR